MPITTTVLTVNQRTPGPRAWLPVAVPQGDTRFELSYDISDMSNPATVVLAILDLSLDGGLTWYSDGNGWGYSQWTARGGPSKMNPRTGLPLTVSSYSYVLPDRTNPNRQLCGSFRITGSGLLTSVVLTTT